MTGYAALLRRPGIARLLAGSIVGRMQLGMASLAILLVVHERTGSFASAGVAVGFFGATGATLMPFQGRLVDRFGQAPVLVACGSGQTGAFVLLALAAWRGASAPLLIVLAAITGALLPPLSPCMRALWAVLVPEPRMREQAYSLDAISQELIWTVGPLIVAVCVIVVSASAALVACAAFTAVGVAVFVTSPFARSWQPAAGGRRSLAGPLASSRIRLLFGCLAVVSIGTGIAQVAIPAIAVRAGSPGAAGVLLGVWSAASAAGGLAFGLFRWRASVPLRYVGLYMLLTAAMVPLVWAHSVPAGAVATVLAGLPLAPLLTCHYTLVGDAAPPGAVAETFAWNTAAAFGAIAAGDAAGGLLVSHFGLATAFVSAALATLAAAVLATRVAAPDLAAAAAARRAS